MEAYIGNEKYAQDILITNPPTEEKLLCIERNIYRMCDTWPGLIEQFGGIEKYRKIMHPTHPIFREYTNIKERIHNVEYLRKRITKNIKNIIFLKIFIARWRNDFLQRYYAPITGTGYKKALHKFNLLIDTMAYNSYILPRSG